MKRRRTRWMIAFGLSLLGGCSSPVSDLQKLDAIAAEARRLMAGREGKALRVDGMTIPSDQWPKTIASLRPQSVAVHRWGVSILMKAHFDGGWGYDVPRDGKALPMPAQCYSEIRKGLFWHDPC